MIYPTGIKNLIESFKNLPGIGDKTAERLTFALVNFDKNLLTDFANAIIDVRDNINRCEVCNNLCEGTVCNICSSDNRDNDVIFVVENAKDIILFEKIGIYNGLYHVLDGLISPLDGINPEDININSLIERVKNNKIKEIILALKPSVEGETTMQYIKKILESYNVKISRIASGIPLGAEMEYIDSMTLEIALEDRINIS